MSLDDYCCDKSNYTSNGALVRYACEPLRDPTFYHLPGRVMPVECETKDWKSIGNFYAIDNNGSLWSIAGTGIAGVNYFNKGLPYKDNLCQIDDGNDWDQIVGDNLFLKNNGELYTINSRLGLDIQRGFAGLNYSDYSIGGSRPFPAGNTAPAYGDAYVENLLYMPGFSVPLQGVQNRPQIPINVSKVENLDGAIDSNFGLSCIKKITYSSNYTLQKGDSISYNDGGGYERTVTVHHVISNTEFVTTFGVPLASGSFSGLLGSINFTNQLTEYLRSFSSASFADYSLAPSYTRARIKSRIKRYILYESGSGDPKKNILDDLQFSRKPTLHVKYYRPSPYNISNNSIDIDGFYHTCFDYIRDNNIHYYHTGVSEEIEAIWKGKLNWIKILNSGSGYIKPPDISFQPTDNEDITNAKISATAYLNSNSGIDYIAIKDNPFVWNKPPNIIFTVASGESGSGASGVCEIIGPITDIVVNTSGDGYTHTGQPSSKLVLVVQANVDDFYVHGIPQSSPPQQTPTISKTPTVSITSSLTASRTQTPSITPSITPTRTITPTSTATYSPTPTITHSPTVTATPVSSFTPTPSVTVSYSPSPTQTATSTNSLPVTQTPSSTTGNRIGSTPAISITPTATYTSTPSSSSVVFITKTPSPTPTKTITRTPSNSVTVTPTCSLSPTPYSPTPTPTLTPSASITATITPTPTPTRTVTATNTFTPTITSSPTPSFTMTPSATSKIHKVALKQWRIADIELYESPIDNIEFIRPLYGNIPFTTFDSNLEIIPIPSSWYPPSIWQASREFIKSFSDSIQDTLIRPGYGGYSKQSFPPLNNPFNTNTEYSTPWLSPNSHPSGPDSNYLIPEKGAQLILTTPTKDILQKCFNHAHFDNCFIYGPGTRKTYITPENIHSSFDFSDFVSTKGVLLPIYICMRRPKIDDVDPDDGYPYYYLIEAGVSLGPGDQYFLFPDNYYTPVPIAQPFFYNKSFPNTKEETANIYFPANSFGAGAVAKLNSIPGPSGYIICDSATIISNNLYNVEPEGILSTIGYDVPTRIGTSLHNFQGDVKFQSSNSNNKCLSENNEIYGIEQCALYKEGNGVRFDTTQASIPISSLFPQVAPSVLDPIIVPYSGIGISNNQDGDNLPISNTQVQSFDFILSKRSLLNQINLFFNMEINWQSSVYVTIMYNEPNIDKMLVANNIYAHHDGIVYHTRQITLATTDFSPQWPYVSVQRYIELAPNVPYSLVISSSVPPEAGLCVKSGFKIDTTPLSRYWPYVVDDSDGSIDHWPYYPKDRDPDAPLNPLFDVNGHEIKDPLTAFNLRYIGGTSSHRYAMSRETVEAFLNPQWVPNPSLENRYLPSYPYRQSIYTNNNEVENYVISPPDIGLSKASVLISRSSYSPPFLDIASVSSWIFNPETLLYERIFYTVIIWPDGIHAYSEQAPGFSLEDMIVGVYGGYGDPEQGLIAIIEFLENTWKYYNRAVILKSRGTYEINRTPETVYDTGLGEDHASLNLDFSYTNIGFGYYNSPEILKLGRKFRFANYGDTYSLNGTVLAAGSPINAAEFNIRSTKENMNTFDGLTSSIIPYNNFSHLYSDWLGLQDGKLTILDTRLSKISYLSLANSFYIYNPCADEDLISFIESQYGPHFNNIKLSVDVAPNGSPFPILIGEDTYLPDSAYNFDTQTHTITFSCGRINGSIPPQFPPFTNYSITASSGGPSLMNNIIYITPTPGGNSIYFQTRATIDSSSLSLPIRGASRSIPFQNLRYIIDANGVLKSIIKPNIAVGGIVPAEEATYYAVTDECNIRFKSLKSLTLITNDDQVYQIRSDG